MSAEKERALRDEMINRIENQAYRDRPAKVREKQVPACPPYPWRRRDNSLNGDFGVARRSIQDGLPDERIVREARSILERPVQLPDNDMLFPIILNILENCSGVRVIADQDTWQRQPSLDRNTTEGTVETLLIDLAKKHGVKWVLMKNHKGDNCILIFNPFLMR
jgi:hypothetical protein